MNDFARVGLLVGALCFAACEPDKSEPAAPSNESSAPTPRTADSAPGPQPSASPAPEDLAATRRLTDEEQQARLRRLFPPDLAAEDEEPKVPAEGGAWGIGERSGGGLPPTIAVRFEKPAYSMTSAEALKGVVLRYRVEVTEEIPGVIPVCQRSAGPGEASPTDLLHLESVEGNGHSYANVDGGLGMQGPYEVRTVPVFSRDFELRWEGKSWSGPSCGGMPKGPAFPPGTYRFQVRVKGTRVGADGTSAPYRVEWSVPVTITE